MRLASPAAAMAWRIRDSRAPPPMKSIWNRPPAPADEPAEVAHVAGLHAAREAEGLDPAGARLAGALDHAALAAALADQRHVMPGSLEGRADPGRPVRVR